MASLNDGASPLARSWYSASIPSFLNSSGSEILGVLAGNSGYALLDDQRRAWQTQVDVLKQALPGIDGNVFFEFTVPRMGRRIDVVILLPSVVFVLEFKVGESKFDAAAQEQVWDYALDLKNFHGASHHVAIVPVLIATEAPASRQVNFVSGADGVYQPLLISPDSLRDRLILGAQLTGQPINAEEWSQSPYRPTPTIIEAARALYAQHSVQELARFDADALNLRDTSDYILSLVDNTRRYSRKAICIVTGVPGAGKTLVGLNLATSRENIGSGLQLGLAESTSGDHGPASNAVFLSGNGPLVAVLREALTRDEFQRRKAQGTPVRKSVINRSVSSFIQNVHHFRDEGLRDRSTPPAEHVVVFDEAQRAWTLDKTVQFMERKKKQPGFDQSEPNFLISCMDRHKDWAVIVCLVGAGQEINTGEAGIDEWIEVVLRFYPDWELHVSNHLRDIEHSATALDKVKSRPKTHFANELHLGVSMRSFRSEKVSHFVQALLGTDLDTARQTFDQIKVQYPVVLTRDLAKAKHWVRSRARGTERFGLVASSKARRLKPFAIDIRVEVNPVYWFLNDRDDTRSSFYLEDAATEFQVQGLELDWACITWDGDLRWTDQGWSYQWFRGNSWVKIANKENRKYLLNAYRVLLTRARQGMVIFVPRGDPTDDTRRASFYDSTFLYLTRCGVPEL